MAGQFCVEINTQPFRGTAQRKQSKIEDGHQAASAIGAQSLTASTPWHDEGNSKIASVAPPRSPAFCKRRAQAREGRRRQGSKPDGCDSARGAGRSPRARRRHAGTLVTYSRRRHSPQGFSGRQQRKDQRPSAASEWTLQGYTVLAGHSVPAQAASATTLPKDRQR